MPNLANILPVNVVGVVSGTVASGTPTSVYSPAAIQNVTIVNADPIQMELVTPAVGSRVKVIRRDSEQSSVVNSYLDIIWNGEEYDTEGWHSTANSPTNIVVPSGQTGLYDIDVNVRFPETAATRSANIYLITMPASGGEIELARAGAANVAITGTWGHTISCKSELAQGDGLRVQFWTNNNDVGVQPGSYLAATRIGSTAT